MKDIPAGVQNNIKIIDDTMLYEGGMEECFFATCEYVDLSVICPNVEVKVGRRMMHLIGYQTDECWKGFNLC